MGKADLVVAVAAKTGLTKKDTETTLEAIIEAVTESLKAKKKVQLIGFGTFSVKHRNARKGRNPSTGKEITIKAADVAHFSASKKLNDLL
ncbi:MAG: HU family DNA-binding protein [Oscillospiraceae bacterium]|jgi:DNA-binding protein HU-beta|nr:HU family DNA-binding protein [Oscillospiraceae bacterium]